MTYVLLASFPDEEEEAYEHEVSHPDDTMRLPVKCGRLNMVNHSSFLKFAKISHLSDTFFYGWKAGIIEDSK